MAHRPPLTLEQFLELSEVDRQYLADFALIVTRNRGCFTPAEEFISGLVLTYAARDGEFTPDNVTDDLEEFKSDFIDSLSVSRDFLTRHPGLIMGEGSGSIQDQREALAVKYESDDERLAALESARELVRKFPDLVFERKRSA